jgi:hypothetical protein
LHTIKTKHKYTTHLDLPLQLRRLLPQPLPLLGRVDHVGQGQIGLEPVLHDEADGLACYDVGGNWGGCEWIGSLVDGGVVDEGIG